MKGLKKLALVTAVAAAPFAQAEMTAMDDALLGEMTGQAGITIDVDLNMTIDAIKYVDQDGNRKLELAAGGAGTGGFDSDGTVNPAGDYDYTGSQGAITMKGLTIDNDGVAARIRGITIDADGTDGLVIGLNQIGDTSGNGIDIRVDAIMINDGSANLAMKTAGVSKQAAIIATGAFASDTGVQTDLATYFGDPAKANWTELSAEEQKEFGYAVATADPAITGANTATLLGDLQTAGTAYASAAAATGAGDGNIGGFIIEDFRNYIQDELVEKYNNVFDMALNDSLGDLNNGSTSGRFVRGEIVVQGTGNSITGTGGLTISGQFGGAMDKLAWVDGYGINTDTGAGDPTKTQVYLSDAGEFGVADMGFFHGVDTDLDGISDTIEGMHFTVDIDVEDRVSWDSAPGADANVAALKLSNMKLEGTIMMGSIYLDSSTDTVSSQSLGSVLIKDIDMSGTSVYVYGH